jgi:diguanylate cyclase (GGDEF)-like protein/PAS domain S-box-containing protein
MPTIRNKMITYAIFGFLLGMVFPIVVIFQELPGSGKSISLSEIWILHKEQPQLVILLLVPLVLAMAGIQVSALSIRLVETSAKLHGQVTTQTRQIQNEHNLFETLITSSPFAVVQLDNDRRIISFNPAFEELFGFTGTEIIGRYLDELIAPGELHREAVEISQTVSSGSITRKESQRKRKDGRLIDVEIFGVPVFIGGERIGALGFYHDISQKKKTEHELQESEARFRSLFDDSPISLWEEDFSDVKKSLDVLARTQDVVECLKSDDALVKECLGLVKVLDINQATLEMYKARSKSELLGGLAGVLVEESLFQFRNELIALASGKTNYECEIAQKRLDGEIIYGALRLSLAPGCEDRWEKVFISIVDISMRKRAEEKLRFLSFHDALTGLYNRAYFDEEMARLESGRAFPISFIVCDLDDLKKINDTYGHDAGDRALKAAAKILTAAVFRNDDFVARIGGDEFAVILQNVDLKKNPSIDMRLQQSIADYNHSGEEDGLYRPISISWGFATIQRGESLIEGYKCADEQMYFHKLSKKIE